MSYLFEAYFNDSGIDSTEIYAINEGVSYTGYYGDPEMQRFGFNGSMRFTANPASGFQFYRWVYHLGSVDSPTQYSYSNPFNHTSLENIWIRAESESIQQATYSENYQNIGFVSSELELTPYVSEYEVFHYLIAFENDGFATFQTFGNYDTKGFLCNYGAFDDVNGVPQYILIQDDDSGEGSNFKISHLVKKSEMLHLFVRMYSPTNAGQVSIVITPPSAPIPGGSACYVYSGGAWVKATPYIYNGGSWVKANPSINNG